MVAETPIQAHIRENNQASTEKDVEQFQWTKQWYSVFDAYEVQTFPGKPPARE